MFAGVELLALPNCETAVPVVDPLRDQSGREVESFAVLAQTKGAEAVLATLWKVEATSTARLMELFYSGIKKGRDKATALAEAQRELIKPGSEYAHPYYWAPLVLFGNWRPPQW